MVKWNREAMIQWQILWICCNLITYISIIPELSQSLLSIGTKHMGSNIGQSDFTLSILQWIPVKWQSSNSCHFLVLVDLWHILVKRPFQKKFYWDLMLVTVQETFYFEYKQRDCGSINCLKMGNIIISWMKNILHFVTISKKSLFQ